MNSMKILFQMRPFLCIELFSFTLWIFWCHVLMSCEFGWLGHPPKTCNRFVLSQKECRDPWRRIQHQWSLDQHHLQFSGNPSTHKNNGEIWTQPGPPSHHQHLCRRLSQVYPNTDCQGSRRRNISLCSRPWGCFEQMRFLKKKKENEWRSSVHSV